MYILINAYLHTYMYMYIYIYIYIYGHIESYWQPHAAASYLMKAVPNIIARIQKRRYPRVKTCVCVAFMASRHAHTGYIHDS